MARVELAKAIELLREELARAQDEGQNYQLQFEISEVEIELLIELVSEDALGGKAGFGVVSVGANETISRHHTHRLLLKMRAKDEATGGRNLEIGRDQARNWPEDKQ